MGREWIGNKACNAYIVYLKGPRPPGNPGSRVCCTDTHLRRISPRRLFFTRLFGPRLGAKPVIKQFSDSCNRLPLRGLDNKWSRPPAARCLHAAGLIKVCLLLLQGDLALLDPGRNLSLATTKPVRPSLAA